MGDLAPKPGSDHLYATTTTSVSEITRSGEILQTTNIVFPGMVSGVAVDQHTHHLWVSASGIDPQGPNNTLYELAPDFSVLRTIAVTALPDDDIIGFYLFVGLEVDAVTGNFLASTVVRVNDDLAGRVYEIDPTGSTVLSEMTFDNPAFPSPTDMSLDRGANLLYVSDGATDQVVVLAVPEPQSAALALAGLACVGAWRLRARSRASAG